MPSSPAIAASRNCFERAERRALHGFFWNGGRLVLSILDDLKPAFEVLTPSVPAGHASASPGCPISESPMSGRSMFARKNRPVTCWPAPKTR
jgi:hypothetical protein